MSTHQLIGRLNVLIIIAGMCVIVSTKPFSFPKSFPAFPTLPSFSQFVESRYNTRSLNAMKAYSGLRLRNDSLIMIYYHDQTVAVVELGANKLLLGCELIEIYTDAAGVRLLDELSALNRPLKIEFGEMVRLMEQCEMVDLYRSSRPMLQQKFEKPIGATPVVAAASFVSGTSASRNNQQTNNIQKATTGGGGIYSLFSGIAPGTKWCGTGDIALNFYDLGVEQKMDRCCRLHDLCPIKVRAYQTRYNLTNNSIYTKSHCTCDDALFDCLKQADIPAAQVMGKIYFNLIQVPCVTNSAERGATFRRAKEGF